MNKSHYEKRYNKTKTELCHALNISPPTLNKWEKSGVAIFEKSRILNNFRKYKKLAQCWQNIKHRCNNSKDKNFKYYGGKGIKNLLTKIDLINIWEESRADRMCHPSIDRIDPEGNYKIGNCRFIEFYDNRQRSKLWKNKKTGNKNFSLSINHDEMLLTSILSKKHNLTCSDIFRIGLNTANPAAGECGVEKTSRERTAIRKL